jgi:hypothetical protein
MAGKVIDINIHGAAYQDYVEFVDAHLNGRTREASRICRKLIARWDYTQDLSDENAVLKLGMAEAIAVVRAVYTTCDEMYKNAKVKDIEVSFDSWTWDDWTRFEELRQARKVAEYEELMHQVCKLPNVDPGQRLTLYNGTVMLKAIIEKAQKLFGGGN